MKLAQHVQVSFVLLLFALPLSQARAASDSDDSIVAKYHLLQFQVGADAAYEQHSSSTYSAIGRWQPEYSLTPHVSVGFDAGFTEYRYSDTSRTGVVEYAISGKYQYEQVYLKAYVGGQSWTAGPYKRAAFMLGPEFGYSFSQPLLPFINSVFLSYTPVFQTATVHELALGVGMSF